MSTEREKFETWASREGYDVDHHEQIPERYAAPSATRAWNAWQARAHLSAPESAPLLLQDENSGRDGRRYNEWHASRPDARMNAREAGELIEDAIRYRWIRDEAMAYQLDSLANIEVDAFDAHIDALRASPPPRVALEKPE